MSRAMTPDEMRHAFLSHIRNSVDYWLKHKDVSIRDRVLGTAFSILTLIDGVAGYPPLTLTPDFTTETLDEEVDEATELDRDWWSPEPFNTTTYLHDAFYNDSEGKLWNEKHKLLAEKETACPHCGRR